MECGGSTPLLLPHSITGSLMGRLFLVRHAQASFLAANYDQLSGLGETQARLLGEYWAARRLRFDRVASGPAVRHRHTAQLVADAYHDVNMTIPEPLVIPELDEFNAEAILSQALPQLLVTNARIRDLHSDLERAGDDAEKRIAFQRLFEIVISMWVDGVLPLSSVESWSDFCARVNRALADFFSSAKKAETSVIFTSGGPLAVAVQRALHLSSQDTLQIAWMSRNCSYAEFLFSTDRLTLSSFNAFPHLTEDSLLTYR